MRVLQMEKPPLKEVAEDQVVGQGLGTSATPGDMFECRGSVSDNIGIVKDFPATAPQEVNAITKEGLRFLSSEELDAAPAKTNWLIQKYLDQNSTALIFGPSGSGKSFVAIDLGLSIAAEKKDWHGHKIAQDGAVFYIAGEGVDGIKKRRKAWLKSNRIDVAIPFFVTNGPVQVLDEKSIADLEFRIDELKLKHKVDPALIVIDTLNRNFGDGDENSTKDMTLFISSIDRIRRRYDNCSVLIVHHSGKSDTHNARGASALKASMDWEYELSMNGDGVLTLKNTKVKDYGSPPKISFKLEKVMLDWKDADGIKLDSCILKQVANPSSTKKEDQKPLNPKDILVFEALKEAIAAKGQSAIPESGGNKVVSKKDWREYAYKKDISESTSGSETEAKRKAFDRAIKGLLARNLITEIKGSKSKRDSFFSIRDNTDQDNERDKNLSETDPEAV